MRSWAAVCVVLSGAAVGNVYAQNKDPLPPQVTSPPAPLYTICENNLRTKLWAQIFVDADLADSEASRIALTADEVRVAVLDTGFDSAGNGKRVATKALEVLKGHKDAADPVKDVDGHGTAVSGTIAGIEGMGIAPESRLTVYRVTSDDSGRCSSADLRASIRKACDDGNAIINLSWGGTADESGEERDEKADAELIAYTAKRGCLVVKAAGNSSYRREYKTNDLDDSYLRVASVTGAGALSPFSSAGEIHAPGSFVYTLRSSLESGSPPNAKSCAKAPGQLINGTSFAAPITAAVAARTLAVFQKLGGDAYEELTPAEKIRLLNRTLKASELRGSISVLRAMLIAERWTKSPKADATVEALSDLILANPPAFCKEALPKFDDKKPAPYVAALRKRFAACEGAADPASILSLVNQLVRGHNLEPALRWIAALDETFLTKELSKARPIADYLWHFLQKKWAMQDPSKAMKYEIDFDEALTFLPFYVATRDRTLEGRKQIATAISTFFDSWDFEQRMSRRPERGSEADAAAVGRLWRLVAAKSGPGAPLQLVKEWVEPVFTGPYSIPRGRKLLAGLRMLDGLAAEATLPAEKKAIESLEWSLFQHANATNKLELEKAAGDKPDLIYIMVWGTDIHHYDVRYLDGFVGRHGDKIRALLGLDQGKITPGKLASFFLRYYLAQTSTIPVQERVDVAMATLDAIAMRRGWNATKGKYSFENVREDRALAEMALQSLKKAYATMKDDKSAQVDLKGRYQEIFRRGTSLEYYATQVYNLNTEWYAKDYLLPWATEFNPFLTKELLYEAAMRIFRVVPKLRKSVLLAEASAIGDTLGALAMYLPWQPHAIERAVASLMVNPLLLPALEDWSELPEFEDVLDPHSNRLEPANYELMRTGNRAFPAFLAAGVVQSWAELLISLDEKDRDNLSLHAPLKALMERRFLCQSLPRQDAWQKPLSEVLRLAKSSYSYFKYSNWDVQWSSMRLLERCK